MASPSSSIIGISLSFFFCALLISPAVSQTCKSQTFTGDKTYPQCLDLTELNAFLHYSYDATNKTLAIVFSAKPSKPGGWIAWAINPRKLGMVGCQTLAAYKDPSNGVVVVKTLNVTSYSTVLESKLSFDVWDMKAEEVTKDGGMMRIFGKIKVPDALAAKGEINQVWQIGPELDPDGMIGRHDFDQSNLVSMASLGLKNANSGGGGGDDGGGVVSSGGGEANSKLKKRNIHGILNGVSWGILFPIGVIIARYMRIFESADPAWFYLHVGCQFSAYIIGVAGWVTGINLGRESEGLQFTGHRNIGLALFCLATIQMFAMLLRPKKDHKFRFFWNIYHHSIGYSIIALGIVNVFKGISILRPEHTYKTAYIGTLCSLGGIALLLEAITWVIVLKRKSNNSRRSLRT